MQLAAEHKNSPEHQAWMYSADPFAAQREVQGRQSKVAAKREAENEGTSGDAPSKPSGKNEFTQATEVKMASELRELVEDAIKKVCSKLF